jgi:hypothetical protein
MSHGSDIENLISGGNLELANRVCDAELYRLLRLKYDILGRMGNPPIGRNLGEGFKDGFRSVVFDNQIVANAR